MEEKNPLTIVKFIRERDVCKLNEIFILILYGEKKIPIHFSLYNSVFFTDWIYDLEDIFEIYTILPSRKFLLIITKPIN